MSALDHDIRWWRQSLARRAELADEDLDELEDHLRILVERKVDEGDSAEVAFQKAVRQLIDLEAIEHSWVATPSAPPLPEPWSPPTNRRLSGGEIVWSFFQDLRYAVRTLAKKPGFTTVVVLVLALGIGINSSMFSLIYSLLWRPPNLEDPREIVVFAAVDGDGRVADGVSYPDYLEYKKETSVGRMALHFPLSVQLQADSEPGGGVEAAGQRVWGSVVSANYFETLGVEPLLGRGFDSRADDGPVEPVVIIGHALWQSRLGGDRGVVGRQLRLNGETFTIIGVAPPGFRGAHALMTAELWLPLSAAEVLSPVSREILLDRKRRSIWAVGRLTPSVSIEQAQIRFQTMALQLAEEYPEANEGISIRVLPESQARMGTGSGPILRLASLVMLLSVALVLLIACVNVANLVLVRAATRRREVGIRLAMGASRARVVRQLLTESLVLAALGGAAGLALAVASMRVLAASMSSTSLPISFDPSLDPSIVAYAVLLTAVTAVLFGLVPALRISKSDWGGSLRSEGRGLSSGASSGGLRRVLVVAEVAACLVLLVSASLFARSLQNTVAIDVGFEPENRLAVSVDLSLNGYDAERSREYYRALRERVASLPGVHTASWAMPIPLDTFAMNGSVYVDGAESNRRTGEPLQALYATVDGHYFATLGTPILRGRGIETTDIEGRVPVAVINQTMAERFWAGRDPIGLTFRLDESRGERIEVVGIAANGKYRQVAEEPIPYFYLSYEQGLGASLNATLVAHSALPPIELSAQVQSASRALDAKVLLLDVKTLENHLRSSAFLPATLAATLVSAFGLLGLALAVVGLYGLLSYSVHRQTGEIGLRIAMGATRRDILKMILGSGMRTTAVGVAIGLLASLGAGRLLVGLLHDVSAVDPISFALVPPILLLVAFLACLVPALRATRIDPMRALRNE